MTKRQYIINVICAYLFCFGAMAITCPLETLWFGIGLLFSSTVTAVFNNIKIKE